MVIASEFEPEFEREHGCTEGEWQRWLPAAVRGHALEMTGPQAARVAGLSSDAWLHRGVPVPDRAGTNHCAVF